MLLVSVLAGPAHARQDVLTNDDIVLMTASGLADELIIGLIEVAEVAFDLSETGTTALLEAGVSDDVLIAMLGRISVPLEFPAPAEPPAPGDVTAEATGVRDAPRIADDPTGSSTDSADDQPGALVISSPVPIQPSPGSLTRPQPEWRRSRGRTIGGASLLAFGTCWTVTGTVVCTDPEFDCGYATLILGYSVGGLALLLGGLLVGPWSDVPASNSIDFAVTPHRVQFGKTFRW